MAVCQHELKHLQEAQEALEWSELWKAQFCNGMSVSINADQSVLTINPSDQATRLRLATVYEDMGRKNDALDLVSDVLKYRAQNEAAERRPREKTAARGEALAQQKLNKSILEDQMRQKMTSMWESAREAEEGINDGRIGALEEYMRVAGTMVETFRLAKRNFGKGRVSKSGKQTFVMG